MKKLTIVLVCASLLLVSTGCQRCRLFRRGARCGTPTFKMPSFRSAPCNDGCNAAIPPNGAFDAVPPTGFTETNRLVDGEHVMNYPIYADGAVVTGKTVTGPESEVTEIP